MIEKYKKDGFIIIKNFFDPKEVDEIRNEAKKVFSIAIRKNKIEFNEESDESFTKALFQLFNVSYNDFLGAAKASQHIISMHRISVSEKLIELVNSFGIATPVFCVKPIIYFNSKFLSKMEGHYKTPPHQDWRSMQGSLNSMVVWIPLVDINKELGAVEFIPGSHTKGLLNTDSDEWFRHVSENEIKEEDFIAAEVKKGDVVIFSAFSVHRSGNNITNNIRWSMHFRYNDASENTFIERGMPHPYIVYKPQQDVITPDFPTTDQLKKVFNV